LSVTYMHGAHVCSRFNSSSVETYRSTQHILGTIFYTSAR